MATCKCQPQFQRLCYGGPGNPQITYVILTFRECFFFSFYCRVTANGKLEFHSQDRCARLCYAGLSNHMNWWYLDSDANVGSKGPSTRLWPFRLLRQIEDIRGWRASICIFGVGNHQPAIKNYYSGI